MPTTLKNAAILMNSGATVGDPSGTAPCYFPRAWVNFNAAVDPLVIRASGNVTSITDNGTGDFTVNLTTAMSDANYAVVGTASTSTGNFVCVTETTATTRTASLVRFTMRNAANNGADPEFCNFAIFR